MSTDISEKVPEVFEQIAEKKPGQAEKLVIFAWSGELDKIWPTLILATTGAAMGKETTVFFTFWGSSRWSRTRCASQEATGCRRCCH